MIASERDRCARSDLKPSNIWHVMRSVCSSRRSMHGFAEWHNQSGKDNMMRNFGHVALTTILIAFFAIGDFTQTSP